MVFDRRQPFTDDVGEPGHDSVERAKAKALKVSDYRDLAFAGSRRQVAAPRLARSTACRDAGARLERLHCMPPLPEREVTRIINRIAKRENRPGHRWRRCLA